MEHVTFDRSVTSIFAAVLGATLVGATLLSPVAVNVAEAQNEPLTAANGVLIPSPYYDPAAARIEDLSETAAVTDTSPTPVPPPEESAATDAPETVAETPDAVADDPGAVTDDPEAGNTVTTVLGGADVAISSVGGSYEVDRPSKRSGRKK
jgi:hypothetical protein